MQVVSISQSLHRRDVGAFCFFGHAKTRESGFPIDQNRTASAGPHIASSLDAESSGLVSQYIEKNGVTVDQMLVSLTIDIGLPSLLSSTRKHGDSNMD